MPNYYVGKNRTELTDWLLQTWIKEGPPVSFIEGFSGVGKTSIARNVIKRSELSAVIVEMPYASSDQADNLFLNLATNLSEIGINDLADAVTEGKSIDQALGIILNRPILIIIDEFQRAMDEFGKPTNSLINFLGRLANHPNISGRVLLLTNRIVERSKWSEAYTIRTLTGLSPEDAEDLLGKLLIDARRDDEIPQERRRDVVNWLGCNPRAIYVLVASLEKSSLNELIGLSPEIWEARDREVSAELLHKLESELLERTIETLLKPETAILLRRLSVHRKSVKRDAIEKQLPEGIQFATVRDELINRFLMEQHSGWFSLNPVVREISLQKLKKRLSELRQAHSHAADHYMRHFKAKEIVDSGKLGGYFVEARYHLVQSQREEELGQIAGRFESHLKAKFFSTGPIPRQLDELNESIATLMSLLETPGAKGLEYYLARLYEARSAPEDLRKALVFAERATGKEAPVDSWILRLRLEAKINGPAQVGLLAREGITRIPAEKGAEQIYFVAAELLAKTGNAKEAITLLKDGLAKLPIESSHLIYSKTADLLAQTDKSDEAITLLKEGLAKLPIESVSGLYSKTADLLAQTGKSDEAIALLKDGLVKLPVVSSHSIYSKTADLLAQTDKSDEAITLLKEGLAKLPIESVSGLYSKTADLLAQTGKSDEAIALLKDGLVKLPIESVSSLYLKIADLLSQTGKSDEAIALLKDGLVKLPIESVSSLYPKMADLLAQTGKSDEAIALLKEGLAKLPVGNFSDLYLKTADLLAQTGKSDGAITLLKEGLAKLPIESGSGLYLKIADLLAQTGKSDGAITLLKEGLAKLPIESVSSLYLKAADLLTQTGKSDEAIALLKEGLAKLPIGNFSDLYLKTGDLLAQTGKSDEAIALLKEGLAKPPVGNLHALYLKTADLLAQTGKSNEAIALLKDGLAKLPIGSLHPVYLKTADLLAQTGKSDEAITLLKGGIAKVPADKDVRVLYQSTGELLTQAGRTDEAITLLKDGMMRIPSQYARSAVVEPILHILCSKQNIKDLDDFLSGHGKLAVGPSQSALGKVLRLIILRDWESAANIAQQESLNFPEYRQLQQIEVFCRLCIHQVEAANTILQRIDINKRPNKQLYWLKTWVELKKGNRDEAKKSLSAYLERNIEENEVNEKFLLQLWDTVPKFGNQHDLAYYFPILPTSFTGLPKDVVRIEYGPSVIFTGVHQKEIDALQIEYPQVISTGQEVFISYAWRGDSENIVNEIDQAFRKRGVTIVRDKRDLGYKGSIKGFMERIGRGKSIVVVLSDKYLRSKNCMFELMQIAENQQFKDRVFPVVLSDANIYEAVKRVEYIKYWENKKAELDAAMKGVGSEKLHGIREEIDLFDSIRDQIAGLIDTLQDMNTLTPDMHRDSDFQSLFDAVMEKLEE